MFYLLAPPAALGFAFHQDQLQGRIFTYSACHGGGLCAGPREVWPPRTSPAQLPQGWEFQEFFGLEPLQHLPAFMVFQPPTGPPPFQQFANGPRDLRYPQSGKLPRDLAHQFQFGRAERASAKGQGFGHSHENCLRRGPW